MTDIKLTPQPLTLEGFIAWAKEAGHYPAITLIKNFKTFCKENNEKPLVKLDQNG